MKCTLVCRLLAVSVGLLAGAGAPAADWWPAQINTVGELLTKTEDDLLNITNFGQKSLDEVKQKLDERGLTLRG